MPRIPKTSMHRIWSHQNEMACQLLAQGQLPHALIAESVGIHPDTLSTWQRNPIFQAKLQEKIERFRNEREAFGIASRTERIAQLNERWRKMQEIILARGAAPDMANVPGGKTGLLIKTLRVIGTGVNAR